MKNQEGKGEPGQIYHVRNFIGIENLITCGRLHKYTHLHTHVCTHTHLTDNSDLMDDSIDIKTSNELVRGVQVESLHISTAGWSAGKLGALAANQTMNGVQTQLTKEVITQGRATWRRSEGERGGHYEG